MLTLLLLKEKKELMEIQRQLRELKEKVHLLLIKHKLKEVMTILFNPKEEISYMLDGSDLL